MSKNKNDNVICVWYVTYVKLTVFFNSFLNCFSSIQIFKNVYSIYAILTGESEINCSRFETATKVSCRGSLNINVDVLALVSQRSKFVKQNSCLIGFNQCVFFSTNCYKTRNYVIFPHFFPKSH